MIKTKIAAPLIGLSLVAFGLTACGEPTQGSGFEVEDCDAEDRANREAECGFTKPSKKKSSTTKSRTKKSGGFGGSSSRSGGSTRRK